MSYAWPFAATKGSLGIIYRFCSGACVSPLPISVVMMGDMHDAESSTGMVLTCIVLGAIHGPQISGAIADATGRFEAVGHYTGIVLGSPSVCCRRTKSPSLIPFPSGSCILIAVVSLYLTKYLMIGSLRGKCYFWNSRDDRHPLRSTTVVVSALFANSHHTDLSSLARGDATTRYHGRVCFLFSCFLTYSTHPHVRPVTKIFTPYVALLYSASDCHVHVLSFVVLFSCFKSNS